MAPPALKVILLGDDTWQLARINSAHEIEFSEPVSYDPNDLITTGQKVAAQATGWGSTQRPVLLALGSVWCPSVTIPLPPGRKSRQRQALSYLLEPYLPWSAEETTCDFECHDRLLFSSAIETTAIQEFINGLGAEILVASISPAARLVVSSHIRECRNIASKYVLLWQTPSGVELWGIEHDTPVLWQRLPHTPEAVIQAIRLIQLQQSSPLTLVVRNCNEELLQGLRTLNDVSIRECPSRGSDDYLHHACHEAEAILKGKRKAALEFRQGALSSHLRDQSLRVYRGILCTCLLCLSLSIAFAFYQRGNHYDLERRAMQDRQSEIFRKLFPGTPLPVGVHARLESEHTRLAAMRGKSQTIPPKVPALNVLEKMLRSVPPGMRFRLLEIRVENGRLYLVGQVREHAEADRIADGLRQANLIVDPPTTHRLPERGVEFRISAKVSSESEKPVARSL